MTEVYFGAFDNVTDPSGLSVLMEHPTWLVTDQEYIDEYYKLKNDLINNFPVYGFISYFDYDSMTGMISNDNHKATLTAQLPKSVLDWTGANPPYTLSDFEDATSDSQFKLTFAGDLLSNIEANDYINDSLERLEYGAAPVILILLVFAFRGVTAALVPVSLVVWNIMTTFTALRLVALGFDVSTYVTNVTTIFGAGLAIDYGLFMHLRFGEEMIKNKHNPHFTHIHAVEKMLNTSGRTVFFSALLMCAALSGAMQFSEFFLTTMTLSIMFPAFFACVGALTFVPTIYIFMGEKIFSCSVVPFENYVASYVMKVYGYFIPSSTNESKCNSFDNKEDIDAHREGSILYEPPSDSDTENNSEAPKLDTVSDVKVDLSVDSDALIKKDSSVDAEYETSYARRHEEDGMWYVGVSFVMKYPIPFAVAIIAMLAALLAVFVTKARFANQGYGNFPLNSPTRYLSETIANDFPSSNGKSSVSIYVETIDNQGVRDSNFIISLNDLANVLKNTTSVVDVTCMTTIDDATNLTQYIAYYSDPYAPQNYNFTSTLIEPFHLTNFDRVTKLSVSLSIEISDLTLGKVVRDIRSKVDAAFYDSNGQKMLDRWGTAGEAADQYDVNRDVMETLPYAIIVIVLSMYLFITILTGSIVLPLKAIFCAGLSLCASFGFLVLVIQDGNGDKLLQFRNNFHCLDPLNLVFICVVAFGLSLDYEVFILGRVQEIYLDTGDNAYSVAKGIQTSARSVTMAAVLLCATVGGFLAADMLLLKQIGMGIGLTILLDATVVRIILVPALMSMLGDWNWYAPKFVKDAVAKLNIKH